jgi:hypothetical protein
MRCIHSSIYEAMSAAGKISYRKFPKNCRISAKIPRAISVVLAANVLDGPVDHQKDAAGEEAND